VWRDPKKINAAPATSAPNKPAIRLFAASGKLLSTVVWDGVGSILVIGVSDSEKLVIASTDFQVRFYNVHGELLHSFFWPQEVKDQGILEAQIWGSGMCVLTRKMQFCVVSNLDDPNPVMYANTGLKEGPASWCVIDSHFTVSGMAEIMVSVGSGTILVVDAERYTDMKLTNGPFSKMAISPTGKILAAFSPAGFVWVVSTDFSQNLCEFKTRTKVGPQLLAWCGVECVVCYWDSVLLVIGPYGDWVRYNYDAETALVLVTEIDGLRIISNKMHEFLQRVPAKTEAIFKTGSIHPAAMLYDATTAFHEKSPKSDEHIRLLCCFC
jgi:hypothetical protein